MSTIYSVGVLMKSTSEEVHHSVIYSPMKNLSNILMVMILSNYYSNGAGNNYTRIIGSVILNSSLELLKTLKTLIKYGYHLLMILI